MQSRRATPGRVLLSSLGALAILILAVALSLAIGVEHIDLRRAITVADSVDATILDTRIMRTALGVLVGAALAPSGVAFQALLRNPLADPFVLGVSGGASVAGTAAIVLGAGAGWLGAWTLPAWAFLGALVAVGIVFALGRVRGRLVPSVALLAGVVLNALAASLIIAIRIVGTPHTEQEALHWLTGTLSRPTEWPQLLGLLAYVLVGVALLQRQAVAMNAFALGDEAAHAVGVEVDGARLHIFIAASLLTGAAVALAGPIGFVGIVVPHVLRGVLGPDHRALVPTAALVGGAFLVLADLLARLAFLVVKTEPTVGVLTALVGAPFFLFVLRKRGSEHLF